MTRRNDRRRPPSTEPEPEPASMPHRTIPPSPPPFSLDDDLDEPLSPLQNIPSPSSTPIALAHDSEPPCLQPAALDVNRVSFALDQPGLGLNDLSEELEGHVVIPTISSEPSLMVNLSRAVRSFYPAAVGNSPNSGSVRRRPVSIGSIIGTSFGSSRRRSSGSGFLPTSLSPLLTPLNVRASTSRDGPGTVSEEDVNSNVIPLPENDSDDIIFSCWFSAKLSHNPELPAKFLLMGYRQGFQIWDVTKLDQIREVCNIRDFPPVFGAVIFSTGPENISTDPNSRSYLVVCILAGFKGTPNAEFIAYSLSTHSVLHRVPLPGAIQIQANEDIIVVSRSTPLQLSLISSHTFNVLKTITSISSRAPYAFALSHRLLAFATAPPSEQEKHLYPSPGVVARSTGSVSAGVSNAVKAGQTIFSGVKALGSKAFAAASGNSDSQAQPTQWFSKSAPATSHFMPLNPSPSRRRDSSSKLLSPTLRPSTGQETETMTGILHEGTWLSVVAVSILTDPGEPKGSERAEVVEVHRFLASRSRKPITNLHWNNCGTHLYAAAADGQSVSVYSIRPVPFALRSVSIGQRSDTLGVEECAPWHLYDLHRGHTAADVLSMQTNNDGRWAIIGTGRGTLHLFATNPYGGPTDINSHVQGKVTNIGFMPPLSTHLVPLVRIRPDGLSVVRSSPSPVSDDQPNSMQHEEKNEDQLAMSIQFLSITESRSLHPALAPKEFHKVAKEGFQDILIFNPGKGTLELFRVLLSVADPTLGSGVQSRSASALTRMMGRPHNGSIHLKSLHAKETVIASWNVRRGASWTSVKRPFELAAQSPMQTIIGPSGSNARHRDLLAQAELTTYSRSHQVLPPSIYLAHQFTFHKFDEDEYVTLLRSGRLAVPMRPIKVRQEVEVLSATEQVTTFVTQRGIPTTSSRSRILGVGADFERGSERAFDEPMANALNESLDYSQGSPPVYPMLPNGFGQGGKSFKDATLPLKRSAQMVGEGLNKLGREIITRGSGVMKSPLMKPQATDTVLEQELDDEELLDRDDDIDGESRSHSGFSGSIATPDEDERYPGVSLVDTLTSSRWDDNTWGEEERVAIEEAETFDEVYPAGVMDEDDNARRPAITTTPLSKARLGKF